MGACRAPRAVDHIRPVNHFGNLEGPIRRLPVDLIVGNDATVVVRQDRSDLLQAALIVVLVSGPQWCS